MFTWKNGNKKMETVKKERQSGQKQETPAHLSLAFSPFHVPPHPFTFTAKADQ